MFVIHMPKTYHIGDTIDCRINHKPARVTWRDALTLVIEPDDVRAVIARHEEEDWVLFTCGDSGETASDYAIECSDEVRVIRSNRDKTGVAEQLQDTAPLRPTAAWTTHPLSNNR